MKHMLITCCLLMVNLLHAQEINSPRTMYSNYLGQEKGLLQLNVKGMTLDDLGYLWVGTEDGLHRFNGYDFKSYLHDPNDSTSIKDDHIRCLQYTNDTLWIATNSDGILGFIPSKNIFFDPLVVSNNIELKTAYKILKLDEKFILFSVKNNLIVFNRKTKTSRSIQLPNTIVENYVTDILQIDDEKYWLATTASGILELTILTSELKNIKILDQQSINGFFRIDNSIFIGTKNGLFIYDEQNKRLTTTTLTLQVKCFYKLNSTQFYIGTYNGLFLYDIEKSSITPYVLKTKEDNFYEKIDINQIMGDAKGNLWIGTEGEGLFHHNKFQKKFETVKINLKEYPLTSNISSFQFLKGKDSTLWIGTKYGLVKYFQSNNEFKLYNLKDQPLIYTIVKDKNDDIWAGGFTSGLLKYNSQTDQFNKISTSIGSLPDNDVVEIIPIDSNTLWICTWAGGIHKFDIQKQEFEPLFINGKRLNRVRTSLIDSKKNIWLGTDQGVYKIANNGKLKRYTSEDSINHRLSGERIFCIKEDYQGNIWFGTNVGLTKLDIRSDKTTLFYKQKGLPNDFIYSILIAKNNNVWVSTNYGISALDTKTNSFKNYTISDGLQNNEFNGKAGFKDEFGHFYFGGISGINIFNPEEIVESPFSPEIYIESVDLFNKPIQRNELFKDTLQFKSNENVITINFSALNFLNPEKCNYVYQLEGFDLDWRPVTKIQSTTYTNLNPGEYKFKVKASNDSGVWNEVPDTMHITIVPPWYLTNLFKITFLLVFLLSGILIYFSKTNRLKKDKLKLERIITQRTLDVRNKNEALKLAFNEAEKQRDDIRFLMKELTHRVKNNLQIISSLLNIQANTMENKQAIDALKMAKNRILAIAHIENKLSNENKTLQLDLFITELSESIIKALGQDEQLKFKIVYDLPNTRIKNINSTMLGLILNELITNTTKYAFDDFNDENKLSILCTLEKEKLKLTIKDNGKGYVVNKDVLPTSLGIELVTEMVEQLNGTIEINSTNGTENSIEIPI